MTFDERDVARDTDGKFGNKVGGAPEVKLGAEADFYISTGDGEYRVRRGETVDDVPEHLRAQYLDRITRPLDTASRSRSQRGADAADKPYFKPRGKVPRRTRHRPSPKDISNWNYDKASTKRVTIEDATTSHAGVSHFEVMRVTPKDGDTRYFFGESAYNEASVFADDEDWRLRRAEAGL